MALDPYALVRYVNGVPTVANFGGGRGKPLVIDVNTGVIYYLDASNAVQAIPSGGGGGLSNINVSAGGASANLSNLVFSNASGVTWGLSASTITASVKTDYQTSGAYLTTAMASNRGTDFVQANATIAGTSISGTIASNGFSLSVGPYITTAMASNRGSDFVQANATIAGTSISGTIASNGFSLSVGPYLTTAALSNHSHGNPTLALTNLTGTTASASNGFTLSLSAGNYLTTARASTDAVGLNTALTANGVAWTVNSSGISLNVPAFLTTAALSNHSHGNPTLALTNLSGTTASASNGLTLSLAVGNFITTARASTDAIGLNTAQTNVTWTVNSSGLSLNAAGYAGTGTSATNASVTLNSAGLAISVAAPGGAAANSYYPVLGVGYVQGTTAITSLGASTVMVQPFFLPTPMSISYARIPMNVEKASTTGASTAARSWSLAQFDTYFIGFYSLGTGANSRSLQYVTGSNVGVTFSNIYQIGAASNNQSFSYSASIPTEGTTTQYTTSGGVNSANFVMNTTILSNSMIGPKWLDVPCAVSLSAGAWWVAVQRSSTTGSTTAGGNFAGMTNLTSRPALYAASQVNVPVLPWGVNTSASTGAAWQVGLGAWTTNTNGATSSSMALSHIISIANEPVLPINLVRQA